MAALLVTIPACVGSESPTASGPGPTLASPGYTLANWQAEEGLPQMTPKVITRTRDGYLWVGTLNGLARFDGLRFTPFTVNNTPAFSSDTIAELFEDNAGILWIGTVDGGLIRYSNGVFTPVPGPKDFPRLTIHSICQDTKGLLWIGTSKGLAQLQDGRLVLTTNDITIKGREVVNIFRGLHEDLWIATQEDIRRLTPEGRFEPPFTSARRVRYWALDPSGRIWASYVEGNLGFLPVGAAGVRESTPRAGFKVDALRFDRDKVLRMGTSGGALFEIALGQTNPFVRLATLDGGITALYQDKDENLWLGVEAQGLWRLRKNTVVEIGKEHGLPKQLNSICQSPDGRVWTASPGGLHFWNGEKFERLLIPGLPGHVSSVLSDREGTLWISSYGGRLARRLKSGEFEYEPTFGFHARTLFQDRDGGFWAGRFLDGLDYRTKIASGRYNEKWGLSSEFIQAIAQDASGDIWVGTARGLNRIRDRKVTQFFRQDGLAGDNIRSLFVDSAGTLWIGSTGGGLTRRKDGRFQSIGVAHGLINDGIEQIIEDDHGFLWLGSNAGLMRADLRQLNDCVSGLRPVVHCMVFRRQPGIPPGFGAGSQPSCMKASDGKLWFLTASGIVVVDPATIQPDATPPPVYVEEIRTDKSVLKIAAGNSEVKIVPAGTRRLEFRYTGLDFKAPSLVRFRHKLEGFDPDWINAGTRREAVYTRIPPGEFRFKVSAANNEGVWNENAAVAAFIIKPFFWQTRTFQVITPVLTLLAIGAAVWGFMSRKHQREIERLAQQHALERERSRIAQDMHDGLGASLVKISLLGDRVESQLGKPEQMQAQIRKITATARQVMTEMDEIVWAVNPKYDTLENFAGYLCQFAREHFEDTDVQCQVDVPAELPAIPLRAEIRHNLLLVVREALNNSFKHSHGKQIRVLMEYAHPQITIQIQDNGIGMHSKGRREGNGLGNMRRRLERLGGEMKIESASNGTRVCLALKIPETGI